MKTLEFKTQINASNKKVWQTMLQPETYRAWVNVSWPGSIYEGNWKQGEEMRFISPGQGGTLAVVTENKLYDALEARHVAVLLADGTQDRTSDIARGWIGTTERYEFTERDGKTTLNVKISTTPEWESMFSDGWPAALAKLKEISEKE